MTGNPDAMGSSEPSARPSIRRTVRGCRGICAVGESSPENHLDSSAESRTHQPCRRGRGQPAGEARKEEWTSDSTSDVILEIPASGDGLDARTRALVDALVEIAFRTLAGGRCRTPDEEGP